MAGSADKLRRCTVFGADAAINYRDEDFVARVREETGGRGVDVILDNMGGAKYLARNVEALAPSGRLVVIGLQGGSTAELHLGQLMSKRAAVLATTLRARSAQEKAAIVRSVVEYVWPQVAAGSGTPDRRSGAADEQGGRGPPRPGGRRELRQRRPRGARARLRPTPNRASGARRCGAGRGSPCRRTCPSPRTGEWPRSSSHRRPRAPRRRTRAGRSRRTRARAAPWRCRDRGSRGSPRGSTHSPSRVRPACWRRAARPPARPRPPRPTTATHPCPPTRRGRRPRPLERQGSLSEWSANASSTSRCISRCLSSESASTSRMRRPSGSAGALADTPARERFMCQKRRTTSRPAGLEQAAVLLVVRAGTGVRGSRIGRPCLRASSSTQSNPLRRSQCRMGSSRE